MRIVSASSVCDKIRSRLSVPPIPAVVFARTFHYSTKPMSFSIAIQNFILIFEKKLCIMVCGMIGTVPFALSLTGESGFEYKFPSQKGTQHGIK
ncbi:hypothetical protein [uncultured Ruminococcus sp.]|uniref:hypothetical protein n=2 Tax=Ruminococcus sp. TaxID=41978 RepID=UPI0025EC3313|nr:hypothetical protein [uncultured Ruminococcus sp.]